MKYRFLLFLLAVAACNSINRNADKVVDTTITVSYDTIPEIRSTISQKPVASFAEPVKDELNDWKFGVDIYETQKTFHYTLQIQAKEARVTDSISLPNFGIWPKPVIEKGKEPLTCIIGFLDAKQQFKPYKKVSFANDRLRISTIASYYVAAYKTKVK
jgi:hypothetical protein